MGGFIKWLVGLFKHCDHNYRLQATFDIWDYRKVVIGKRKVYQCTKCLGVTSVRIW